MILNTLQRSSVGLSSKRNFSGWIGWLGDGVEAIGMGVELFNVECKRKRRSMLGERGFSNGESLRSHRMGVC